MLGSWIQFGASKQPSIEDFATLLADRSVVQRSTDGHGGSRKVLPVPRVSNVPLKGCMAPMNEHFYLWFGYFGYSR